MRIARATRPPRPLAAGPSLRGATRRSNPGGEWAPPYDPLDCFTSLAMTKCPFQHDDQSRLLAYDVRRFRFQREGGGEQRFGIVATRRGEHCLRRPALDHL